MLIASTWLYAALRPIVSPVKTVPYDLFTLFALRFVFAVVQSFGFLYDSYAYGFPLPSSFAVALRVGDIVAVLSLLVVVLNMPLVTSKTVKENVSALDFKGVFSNYLHTVNATDHGRHSRRLCNSMELDIFRLGRSTPSHRTRSHRT